MTSLPVGVAGDDAASMRAGIVVSGKSEEGMRAAPLSGGLLTPFLARGSTDIKGKKKIRGGEGQIKIRV